MTPLPIYDLFVSYTEADRAWVEGYLLGTLQQADVRYHSEAAFALGVPRIVEFERAIKQSSRTLLILSPAYLADTFGQFVDVLVNSYGVETATWPVIPLVLHPVSLPSRLSMLTALYATNPENWQSVIERLCAELHHPVSGPAPKLPCPYPGMVPFTEHDAGHFFGRDREVAELGRRLRHQNYIFVIGPSGSGKSSLVFAGLVPELHREEPGKWIVKIVRPGHTPLPALMQALGRATHSDADYTELVEATLARTPGAKRLLLVIDQFEELFTQTQKEHQESFIATIMLLRQVPNCVLMPIMRADFYEDLMSSNLWPVDLSQRLEIASLRGSALRNAIAKPAEDLGVYLEAHLLERLLVDAADEPGVLPLIQETMVLLWQKMLRRLLPFSAYEDLGSEGRSGLAVAIAAKADATLAALPHQQQIIAHRIFLRLIQFGEGRPDTRRQQPTNALRTASDDRLLFNQTLQHLTNNRLVTLTGGEDDAEQKVDIAHEALIAGWPTLQGWVTERREMEQARRRLEAQADEWSRLGRDRGGLLDDIELPRAEQWLSTFDTANLGYSEVISLLVRASRKAQAEAMVRQRRAARMLFVAISAATILTIGFLIVAVVGQNRLSQQQSQARATAEVDAAKQRNLSETQVALRAEADTARSDAEEKALIARSRELAAQSQASLTSSIPRSLLLSIEAVTTTMRLGKPDILAAEDALRQALAESGGRGLSGHTESIVSVTVSSDNHWLLTRDGDGVARLWNLTAADPSAASMIVRRYTSGTDTVIISPDSHWLVTTGRSDPGTEHYDTLVFLWDLTANDLATSLRILPGPKLGIQTIAVSTDSHWLIVGGGYTVRLWDLSASDPATTLRSLPGYDVYSKFAAISPNSHWLITIGHSLIRLWDLTASNPTGKPTLLQDTDDLEKATISPNSHWLITYGNTAVHLWNLTTPISTTRPLVLYNDERISTVAVSLNSHWLVTYSDTAAYLWNLTSLDLAATPIALFKNEKQIAPGVFSPDSHWLMINGASTRLWDLTAPDPASKIRTLPDYVGEDTPISVDGHWLVTVGEHDTAHLWDLTASDPATTLRILPGLERRILPVVDLAFSPDNRWLATGSWDGTTRLWDLKRSDLASAPVILHGHEFYISALTFSPNSRWLIVGSADRTIRLWDLAVPNLTVVSPHALRGHTDLITAIAISPHNDWLATGSADRTVRLWDLTAPDPAAGVRVLRGHEDRITALTFSPDDHWLATGSADRTVRLWDLTAPDPATGVRVLRGHEEPIKAVVISFNSHWLATASDKATFVWDLSAPDPAIAPRILGGHEGAITGVAFSPDNHWLATTSGDSYSQHEDVISTHRDSTIRLWDLRAPNLAAASRVLRGHEQPITVVVFSPDSHWLVTGSEDATVRVWDMTIPDPGANPIMLLGHAQRITALAFSPDNRWLFTAGLDPAVRVWSLTAANSASGLAVDPIVLRVDENVITAMAISPNGHRLVTVGKTAHLLDLTTLPSAAPSLVLRHPADVGEAVVISSDNRWIVTVGGWNAIVGQGDTTAYLWEQRPEDLVDIACRTAGRNLTHGEWEQYLGAEPYHKTCPNLPSDPTFIKESEALAQRGEIKKAVAAYREAQRLDPSLELSAGSWNALCWFGSLWGYPADVLDACERAVQLIPTSGAIRDSRGLARALTGDYKGAIEDFNFYLEWSQQYGQPERDVQQRKEWIHLLEAGQNPFTKETLAVLRNDRSISTVSTVMEVAPISTARITPYTQLPRIIEPQSVFEMESGVSGCIAHGIEVESPIAFSPDGQHETLSESYWIKWVIKLYLTKIRIYGIIAD